MANKDKDTKLFQDFPPVSKEAWLEKVNKDLKGADYEKKLVWRTYEGFKVQPFYREEDLKGKEHLDALPGKYPFTRGNKEKGNDWEIRQDISIKNPQEANKIAVDAIKRGAQGIGFNAKEIENYEDMETLLNGINIEETAIHFISSSSYPSLVDLFLRYIEENGFDKTKVKGSVNFDSLSWLLLHKKYYTTGENNYIEAKHVLDNLASLPAFKAITINGQYYLNAGASAVQELAFSLAMANEYLAQLVSKGMKIDDIASKTMFSFGLGSSYFMEIAKLRAARMLWAQIVKQYEPKESASEAMYLHTVTADWNKTVYDPYVNMLRTTTESMSGAIGGTNSMTIKPFDITYKKPDNFSNRIARNQQIILKEEAYFGNVTDPGAGSYYIETLTDSVASHAWELFKEVESKGGFADCIFNGFIYDQIEETSQKKIADIDKRKKVFVGTNNYPNSSEDMLDKLEPITQADKLAELKLKRGAEEFEALRLATEDFEKKTGKRPFVMLFKVGNPAMRSARAMFSANFFGVGGYRIIDEKPFDSVDEGIKTMAKHNPEIVVICSSDEEYATLGIEAAKKIKEQDKHAIVVIAGNPKDIIDRLKEAGVDDFIHVRTNILESLQKYNTHYSIS